MALFLLLAYAFVASQAAPRDKPQGLPWWLGGVWTPHGAFISGLGPAWGVLLAYFVLLGACYAGGTMGGIDPLSGLAAALSFLLMIQAAFALRWANEQERAAANIVPVTAAYKHYRIASHDPGTMTQILMNPSCMADQQETPLAGIRQITNRSLAFIKTQKGVIIQPVDDEFFGILDLEMERLQREAADQTDKAVTAVDQRLSLEQMVESLETQNATLTQSRSALAAENQTLRTTSRLSGKKDYSKMSREELEGVRQSLLNEARTVNEAIASRKPATKTKIPGTTG
jgi:hypothetical protein